MRFFSTVDPNKPELRYCIPALERLDLDEALRLVREQKYFVLHAPRQTGKTSVLLALQGLLNGQGHHCLYATVEGRVPRTKGRGKRCRRCSPDWPTRRGTSSPIRSWQKSGPAFSRNPVPMKR